MRVLAAYDFSDPSKEALEEARAEVKASGGVLGLCHVLPVMYELQPFFGQFKQDATFDVAATEAELRRSLEDRARELTGGADVELFIEQGVAYAEIVRRAEAWGADLIVVGSHGRTGLTRVLVGSVAERVVRSAPVSVLVARAPKKRGVVLAATDLSEASLPAVEASARAAERRNARLVVVTAVDWSLAAFGAVAGAPFGAVPVLPPPEVQEQTRGSLQTALQQVLERTGVSGEAIVLDGSPAAAILHHAEQLEAELVVVGTHGRTGLTRLALGSVAEKVVRGAGSSVLVVRAPEKQ